MCSAKSPGHPPLSAVHTPQSASAIPSQVRPFTAHDEYYEPNAQIVTPVLFTGFFASPRVLSSSLGAELRTEALVCDVQKKLQTTVSHQTHGASRRCGEQCSPRSTSSV